MIDVLYFARFREQLGTGTESLEPVADVAALIQQLQARGGAWEAVFGGHERLMMAVNREMAEPSTPLSNGDEVAFFPPVTGG